MLERYRTLRAIANMQSQPFTVAELATVSGVQPETVRTILTREAHLIERIGKLKTGAPGGQPIRYRLRPEGKKALRRLLAAVDELAPDRMAEQAQGQLIPTSLLAAEEMLLELRNDPDADRRRAKLELASLGLDEGRVAADSVREEIRPALMAHAWVVADLLRLADLEESWAEPSLPEWTSSLHELRDQLDLLCRALEHLDPHLARETRARLDGSPLAPHIAPRAPVAKLVSLDLRAAELQAFAERVWTAVSASRLNKEDALELEAIEQFKVEDIDISEIASAPTNKRERVLEKEKV